MYPNEFDYYRAESVDDALELLAAHSDEETALIAGGHSLLPTMKTGLASPDALVDISEIDELNGIEADGDAVSIGANTLYADVADSDLAWERATAVAEATQAVGDIQVRNRGTLGGNVAHSDPAGDPPAAVLASNATIHAQGPDGTRAIDADDFFVAVYTTALEPGEILTRVEIPTLGENDVGAYAKKPSPSSGYAMVGVAARLQTDGETIQSARVAANGAFDHATRLRGVEDALAEEPIDDELAETAAARATDGVEEWELMDDIQASAEFRAELLEVYTRRALGKALDRVTERVGPGIA